MISYPNQLAQDKYELRIENISKLATREQLMNLISEFVRPNFLKLKSFPSVQIAWARFNTEEDRDKVLSSLNGLSFFDRPLYVKVSTVFGGTLKVQPISKPPAEKSFGLNSPIEPTQNQTSFPISPFHSNKSPSSSESSTNSEVEEKRKHKRHRRSKSKTNSSDSEGSKKKKSKNKNKEKKGKRKHHHHNSYSSSSSSDRSSETYDDSPSPTSGNQIINSKIPPNHLKMIQDFSGYSDLFGNSIKNNSSCI